MIKKIPQPTEPASSAPIAEYHERKITEARAAKIDSTSGPLFIRKDDHGNLFQDEGPPTELDLELESRIVLDDATLWEAYQAACRAQEEAEQVLWKRLRKPTEEEIKAPPTPSSSEIQALACLYVTERLRSCRKINMAFSALAGMSEAQVESAWGLAKPIAEPVPSEMVEALHSKGWISNVGSGCYTITCRGQKHLETAAM